MTFKRPLESGKIVWRLFVEPLPNAKLIEAVGLGGGFDAVFFDLEHSANTHGELEVMLMAYRQSVADLGKSLDLLVGELVALIRAPRGEF